MNKIAKKLMEKAFENGQIAGFRGGLDYINISGDIVTFHDRGVNGKGTDIIVNVKTKKVRERRWGD